jgi:ubiquinone/menaquinone biosynthesis C-methylase UbiE
MTKPAQPTSAEYLLAHPTDRDRLYVQFDLYRDRFYNAFARTLSRAGVDPQGKWRALDAACGEGLYAAALVDRYPGAEVVGIDRDPEAISTAQTAYSDNVRLSFHLGDVHDDLQPVVGTGFHIAFVQFGLTHFHQGKLALRQICDVMRPGSAITLLDATERGFEYPHPSAEPFANAMRTAWRGFGTFAAGDRYEPLLSEAGFVEIITEPQNYAMGGPTPAGKACFRNMVELITSMRESLVMRARVISAEDFDNHLANLIATGNSELEGTCFYQMAIARKPA